MPSVRWQTERIATKMWDALEDAERWALLTVTDTSAARARGGREPISPVFGRRHTDTFRPLFVRLMNGSGMGPEGYKRSNRRTERKRASVSCRKTAFLEG